MKHMKLFPMISLIFISVSCTLNSPPTITNLSANPDEVFTDEKTLLMCEANGSYGQTIDYTWYCDFGTLPEIKTDPNVVWIAPSQPGQYDIFVEVTDGINSTTESVTVNVVENHIQYFTLMDSRDGQTYSYFNFEGQTWMAENLGWLPEVSPPEEGATDEAHYYVYGYQGSNVDAARLTDNYAQYGVLYNHEAAMTACPDGWHLPTDEEWKTLEKNLGMDASDANEVNWRNTGEVGYFLKSKDGWFNDGNGVNRIGFNALPGGYRYGGTTFDFIEDKAFFWTATTESSLNAWCRYLYYQNDGINRYDDARKKGFSVRCIQD